VITIVKILLSSDFQLVTPEKPDNPKEKVTIHRVNTMTSGCICIELVKTSILSLHVTNIKNIAIQIKENIKDQKLIFFMFPPKVFYHSNCMIL
jgi:hypothetical protein